jgi:hypothetical protein
MFLKLNRWSIQDHNYKAKALSVAGNAFDLFQQHQPAPKLRVLAAAAFEHRAATTDSWIFYHLLSDAQTIAATLFRAAMVTLTSGVLLESLHVEMRRGHAMIATLMTEAVASGAAFEDVASLGVFPWEHSLSESRVVQLGDRDESRCTHLVPNGLVAVLAISIQRFVVGTNVIRDGLVGTAALGVFRRRFPLCHERFALFSILVEFLEGEESVVLC